MWLAPSKRLICFLWLRHNCNRNHHDKIFMYYGFLEEFSSPFPPSCPAIAHDVVRLEIDYVFSEECTTKVGVSGTKFSCIVAYKMFSFLFFFRKYCQLFRRRPVPCFAIWRHPLGWSLKTRCNFPQAAKEFRGQAGRRIRNGICLSWMPGSFIWVANLGSEEEQQLVRPLQRFCTDCRRANIRLHSVLQ